MIFDLLVDSQYFWRFDSGDLGFTVRLDFSPILAHFRRSSVREAPCAAQEVFFDDFWTGVFLKGRASFSVLVVFLDSGFLVRFSRSF